MPFYFPLNLEQLISNSNCFEFISAKEALGLRCLKSSFSFSTHSSNLLVQPASKTKTITRYRILNPGALDRIRTCCKEV